MGGADENLRACGDWKLWADMAHTRKVAYICEALTITGPMAQVRSESMPTCLKYSALSATCWNRFKPQENVLAQVWRKQAEVWVPAVMSAHVPLRTKKAVLRIVKAIDPHPLRRALRPALLTAQLKIQHHWRDLRSILTSDKYARR